MPEYKHDLVCRLRAANIRVQRVLWYALRGSITTLFLVVFFVPLVLTVLWRSSGAGDKPSFNEALSDVSSWIVKYVDTPIDAFLAVLLPHANLRSI